MSSIKGPYAAAPRAWKENEAHEIAKRAGPSHDLNQYAGQLRADLTKRGIEPVIPPRSNRKTPIEYDHEAYKRRNLIERCVNRLTPFRRMQRVTKKPPEPTFQCYASQSDEYSSKIIKLSADGDERIMALTRYLSSIDLNTWGVLRQISLALGEFEDKVNDGKSMNFFFTF